MVLLYNVLAALINVAVVIAFKILAIHNIISPTSTGMIRNAFGFLALLPFIIFQIARKPRTLFNEVPHKFNIYLGIIGGISMILWPIVFINIETHIAMTFAFLLPFLANIMLKFFCKEEIPLTAWLAKILCLIAVLIILHPQLHKWNLYHNLGLACVLLWAICSVFQKKIGQSKTPAHIALYWYIFLTTITTVIFSIKALQHINWSYSWYFLGIGFLNSVGNLMTFLAFKYGKGYFVQMMEFVKFTIIIFIDITLFGVQITPYTIAGSLAIVLAVLILIAKEYKKI